MVKREKSKRFAVRIVKCCRFLQAERQEYVLSKQLMRSGTSIGANIAESVHAQSRRDFVSKINIALKEAGETRYWLEILYESELISKEMFDSLSADCDELARILASTVRTIKQNA
ncbi:four helix bundle protein [uncultured Alistipes sp.]|uniref:four helix bundle protein n=1 Tax=uncultured Alistipes sp. TaxID=538949 RepID=UPI0025FB3CEC|nr:four helix bundle protein [uncultured Alistipes sp.]